MNILCQSRAYVIYLKHEVKIFFINYFINKEVICLKKFTKIFVLLLSSLQICCGSYKWIDTDNILICFSPTCNTKNPGDSSFFRQTWATLGPWNFIHYIFKWPWICWLQYLECNFSLSIKGHNSCLSFDFNISYNV